MKNEELTSSITTVVNAHHPGYWPVHSFQVIWLDASLNQPNEEFQHALAQLKLIINDVHLFTEQDPCIDFLTDLDEVKVSLIVEDIIGQQIISLIDEIPQLNAIYIYSHRKSFSDECLTNRSIIKGVHTTMTTVCQALKVFIKQYNRDSISLSFIPDQNLDQLEPSFMYTHILKEILFEMTHDDKQAARDFVAYCRKGNFGSDVNITRFENEYRAELAIWWYTFPSFLYSMLNGALRLLRAETLIHMGFFIADLHKQLQRLHEKQIDDYAGKSFRVYRGQGLSNKDFTKLRQSKDGLLSFNNFLSTSKDEDVSQEYAVIAATIPDTIGILFRMSIDPLIPSAVFADIQQTSYYEEKEGEILFSMHTIFRIGEITQMDDGLYQVDLQLTADDDPQLRLLTEHIREETSKTRVGWDRLGMLLAIIGEFSKAEQLYQVLLNQTSDEQWKASYYNNLGSLSSEQGEYEMAISYYEKALELQQTSLPCDRLHLVAIPYNNLGGTYLKLKDYPKALSFYEKANKIFEQKLREDHPDWMTSYSTNETAYGEAYNLATSYNNVGAVYENMGEYTQALLFYKKAIDIQQRILPANHPDLSISYSNIAGAHHRTDEYRRALFFCERALDTRQKTLPSNHPDLAKSHNNIAAIYVCLGQYAEALSSSKTALEMNENVLPTHHPDLATSYHNIGAIYNEMGEYSKALSFYEQALEIRQKIVPKDYLSLAVSYDSIGSVLKEMGEYSKALSYLERAHDICQRSLPVNHPDLAHSYSSMGTMYHYIGEYSKALVFHEKELEIRQKTLPSDHTDLATSYNNIASVYHQTGKHSKALLSYEKALKIERRAYGMNDHHPSLAATYNNIGLVYRDIGEYSQALAYLQRAHDIRQHASPVNRPALAISFNNIGAIYEQLDDSSKALSFYEKALEILRETLPADHPNLANCYCNIATAYENLEEYEQALSFYKQAFEIQQTVLPDNHPLLATTCSNIGSLMQSMEQYSLALEFYQKALDIRLNSLPEFHPSVAISHYKIGLLYEQLEEYSKALGSYKCALNVWQHSLPADHPHIQNVQKRIETVKASSNSTTNHLEGGCGCE